MFIYLFKILLCALLGQTNPPPPNWGSIKYYQLLLLFLNVLCFVFMGIWENVNRINTSLLHFRSSGSLWYIKQTEEWAVCFFLKDFYQAIHHIKYYLFFLASFHCSEANLKWGFVSESHHVFDCWTLSVKGCCFWKVWVKLRILFNCFHLHKVVMQ